MLEYWIDGKPLKRSKNASHTIKLKKELVAAYLNFAFADKQLLNIYRGSRVFVCLITID